MIMMAVAMLVYMYMQPPPKPEEPKPGKGTGTAAGANGAGQKPPKNGGVKPAPKVNKNDIGGPAEPVRLLELKTEEMRLVISSQGAGIERLELVNHHPSAEEKDKPLVLLDKDVLRRGRSDEELAKRTLPSRRSMVLSGFRGKQDFENWNWKLTGLNGKPVTVATQVPGSIAVFKPCVIKFQARRGGLEVIKTYTIHPAGFDLDVEIVVINRSAGTKPIEYRLIGAAGIVLDEPSSRYSAITAMLAGRSDPRSGVETQTVAAGKAAAYWKEENWEDLELSKGHTEWAAVRGRYFSAMVYPEKPKLVITAFAEPLDINEQDDKRANLAVGLKIPDTMLKSNEKITRKFHMRVGPQVMAQMEKYEYAFDQKTKVNREFVDSIDFGWSWFAWLSRFFLRMLQYINMVVPNYGVCIVLLTLCVKLVLHPMSLKGQKSMQRMQEIQPKIQALQKQLKGDPQKMQQAQMRLFKEEGVNPAGGCLPLLMQMPIFIGLYGAIRGAFDFRQESFLWISDLSRPDMLFNVDFWPHQLNVLPVLYAALMIAQSSLQPLPKDGQARQTAMMMRFMPLVFFFIIYYMPSAFVLYFAASSVIGFVEGRIIKRQLRKAKEAREAAAGTGSSTPATDDGDKADAPPPDPKAFWQGEAKKKKGKKK
jgi:YidC/Oxa1 family membrane protein insertase